MFSIMPKRDGLHLVEYLSVDGKKIDHGVYSTHKQALDRIGEIRQERQKKGERNGLTNGTSAGEKS